MLLGMLPAGANDVCDGARTCPAGRSRPRFSMCVTSTRLQQVVPMARDVVCACVVRCSLLLRGLEGPACQCVRVPETVLPIFSELFPETRPEKSEYLYLHGQHWEALRRQHSGHVLQ